MPVGRACVTDMLCGIIASKGGDRFETHRRLLPREATHDSRILEAPN